MVRQLLFVLLAAALAAVAFLWLPGSSEPKGEAPPVEPAAAAPASAAAAPGLDACPERLPAGTAELACHCTGEAMAIGEVWGAGPYTDDSAICRAALHAGAIGVEGGPVRVAEAPGRESYPGDISRSVASRGWDEAWPRSVVFRPVGERR